jgi:hypothetical protein
MTEQEGKEEIAKIYENSFSELKKYYQEHSTEMGGVSQSLSEKMINDILDFTKKAKDATRDYFQEFLDGYDKIRSIKDGISGGFGKMGGAINSFFGGKTKEEQIAALEKEKEEKQKKLDKLKSAGEVQNLSSYETINGVRIRVISQAEDNTNRNADAVRSLSDEITKLQKTIDEMNIEKPKSDMERFADAINNAWQFSEGLVDTLGSVKSAIELINDLKLKGAIINAGANILNFITGGFSKPVTDVLKGVVSDSFSGSSGGRSIEMFANGGVVNRATMAVVGEGSSSEAILPLNQNTFANLGKGIAEEMDYPSMSAPAQPINITINTLAYMGDEVSKKKLGDVIAKELTNRGFRVANGGR